MEFNCDQNVIFKDINELKIETFFSSYVKEIVTDLSISDTQIDGILDNDLCLNWDQVIQYIPKEISYNNFSEDSNEWMRQKISELINSVYKVFDKISNENTDYLIQLLNKNLFWTQKLSNNFIESLQLLKESNNKRDVNNILSLQLISSSLEQSLGNIVLTKVSFVPPLLKDLLTLPELSSIIGDNTIRLLQLTIGPPITINIRNILWHGFVSHEDIDQRFAYFLLCICVTIGRDLDHKYRDQVLPQRPLTVFGQQLNAWNSMFPILDSNDLSLISRSVLENCPFILKRMSPLWKYAFDLYNENKFGFCIAIIFPQLESCLRFIYSTVNGMTCRIMTAIAKEYYTTFAEILSQTLPDSEEKNAIHTIFDQSLIELLLDIIIIPEGPRIRDKLSHGQIDIFAVERYVANHVICAAVCVLVSANIKLNQTIDYLSLDIVCNIMKTASHYKCLFHPISQLRTKIIDLASSLSEWNNSSIDQSLCVSNDTPEEIENLLKIVNSLVFSETLNYVNTEQAIIVKLQNYNLNILSNRKSESEIIVLRQIVDNIVESSENMRIFLELRHQQYSAKQLRSRQRLNYILMLKNLQFYRTTFSIMLFTLYSIFMNNFQFNETENELSFLKCLKYFLHLCQNMNSKSHLSVNKWDKCQVLCKKMCTFLCQLFSKFEINCCNQVNQSFTHLIENKSFLFKCLLSDFQIINTISDNTINAALFLLKTISSNQRNCKTFHKITPILYNRLSLNSDSFR